MAKGKKTAAATENENEFVPPAVSWDLQEFVKAPLPVIMEKTVDCPTCPVAMLCQAGTGGSGYVCEKCGATGVWINESDQDNVMVLDCGDHKFETKPDEGKITLCPLCDGTVMRFEYAEVAPHNFYIRTVHSKVSAETRQSELKKALDHWVEFYNRKKKRK